MQYDGVKSVINNLIKRNKVLRKLFYIALDCLILRQWYVKRLGIQNAELGLVLDAGAGFCQYSDYVLSKNKDAKVLAIDLKDDFLNEYAHSLSEGKRKRFAYNIADLQDTDLSPTLHTFNTVLAIDILEHIPDDIAVLRNFHNLMSPGGTLIISTPSDKDDTASFTDEHIRNGYSLKDLTEKLQQTGFKVIHSEYTYGFWGKIYWHLIMRNSLTLLKLSKYLIALLPIYLVIIYPIALLCMCLDFWINKTTGNGILVIAKK